METCWACTKENKKLLKLKDPTGQVRSFCLGCVNNFAYTLSPEDIEKNKQKIIQDLLKID